VGARAGIGTRRRFRAAALTRFGVAILAGGQGLRMGGGKPLRRLAGRTLVEHAVRRAQLWDVLTVLVLRSADQAPPNGLRVIHDDAAIPGPLGGLAAALAWGEAAGLDAVLTLPCDMPFLPMDLPGRLLGAIQSGASVAVAASGGRSHPVCALWRPDVLSMLRERASCGRLSLKGVAEQAGASIAVWSHDEGDPFFNINTEEDLARAESRMLAGIGS